MLTLRCDDVRLDVSPELGGSIVRFDVGEEPIFRPAPDHTNAILQTASFPLAPFAGRIAEGRFSCLGVEVALPPNLPGDAGGAHAIHGQAWLCAWQVEAVGDTQLRLRFDHAPGDWPWAYAAEQEIALRPDGFVHALALVNRDTRPMPAGLGVHPYFSRNAVTRYRGLHRREWQSEDDGIPRGALERAAASDWWQGRPVGERTVDTTYGDREGDLRIAWPDRGIELAIQPSANLAHTVVYVPDSADFFCVEPVSHVPNAHNAADPERLGLHILQRGERLACEVTYRVRRGGVKGAFGGA